MESSRPKPTVTNEKEKSWMEKGKDLLNRAVGSEEEAVKKFLKESHHYQTLLKIIEQSRNSKQSDGYFGGNSFFQKTLYQISDEEEKLINDLQQAKTFAELYHKNPIKKELLDNPHSEPALSKASVVWQGANFGYYSLLLAREIKEFANRNFYSLEPPAPQFNYVGSGCSY